MIQENNNKKTILILEDDRDLCEGICLSLNSKEFSFVSCQTIVEARKQWNLGCFDLLILDINLSDGSGLEFLREVRRSSKVPVALLTAKDMELDIVAGLECGADDYITKPFSLMVLSARIRALLRRNVEKQEKNYQDRIFQFSFDTMKFYKNNHIIELSKTEQRILSFLVFHEGQIMTRERLLAYVWPEGTEYVEDNALSVGIRRLRDKLEDKPSKPKIIKTVYGKGYLWERQD